MPLTARVAVAVTDRGRIEEGAVGELEKEQGRHAQGHGKGHGGGQVRRQPTHQFPVLGFAAQGMEGGQQASPHRQIHRHQVQEEGADQQPFQHAGRQRQGQGIRQGNGQGRHAGSWSKGPVRPAYRLWMHSWAWNVSSPG
jgi:hypothetical protein